MSDFDLLKWTRDAVTETKDRYIKDLSVMSEEDLLFSPGGKARTGFDFTYEVLLINRRIAKRLKGEDPGPMPWTFGEGWLTAPPEWQSKEKLISEYSQSMDELYAAIGDDAFRMVQLPTQEQTVFELVNFCCIHNNYHEAQLNYVQSVRGDDTVHWED